VNPSLTFAPEDYVTKADCLPAAPRVLPQLLTLLSDPDCETNQVVELISFDPGLTAKVLRIANSAAFALARPVTNIDEAVNRLGLKMIYQLVAAAASSSALQPASKTSPPPAGLWEQSVTTALAAQILAKDLKLDEGTQFTAGLLHDLGKVVLAEVWKEQYLALLEASNLNPRALVDCEKEMFNVNHAELGGRLLAHWKFPPAISASVWNHPAPLRGMPFERETACLTLAEFIAESGAAPAAINSLTTGQVAALDVLGFAPDQLKTYAARTQENFAFVNAMCQMRG
jgi:putative nucleotidyltransferase with HDIG domain